jgi:hypothetical protein
MPKTLIVHAPSPEAAAAAASVAEGARALRFSEVELRSADAVETLAGHHAVIVGELSPDALAALVARSGSLRDVVASAFGGQATERWSALRLLADAGCLLVPPSDDLPALGRRVATVGEWVRHAKSHEHHHH